MTEEHRACPCIHTTPCRPDCTCVQPFSSFGCRRCASYGSPEQQRAKSESLATRIDGRIVRVGVATIIRRPSSDTHTGKTKTKILMGKRKGSHGAGTWSFPGGHLEWGESVTECAGRETEEETGMPRGDFVYTPLTFTNDVFEVEDKHYITLYVQAHWAGSVEPRVMEPHKCEEWRWFDAPPEPLFLPVRNLLLSGFNLWTP
jgi:8-oxo-dGTP diphosphatase